MTRIDALDSITLTVSPVLGVGTTKLQHPGRSEAVMHWFDVVVFRCTDSGMQISIATAQLHCLLSIHVD